MKKPLGKSILRKALGKRLVSIARKAISDLNYSVNLKIKKGVFVTLYSYPKRNLRGCIGIVEEVELGEGICSVARSAAFHDPRFKPLFNEEYVIDVSILDKPELVKDINDIKLGEDGLIIEYDGSKGLLLPQVAVEHGFNKKEFLECCCMKAGLDKDYWKNKGCKVYKFKAVVFSEEKPDGRVIKKLK